MWLSVDTRLAGGGYNQPTSAGGHRTVQELGWPP
jgi:hypothetical protein